jgi:hypothetical protein
MNWLQSNLLILNCNTTHFLQFLTKKTQTQILSSNSVITNLNITTFPDSTLSWKDHIADLTSKLNNACYAIRTIKPFITFVLIVYFSYFHSVISYGIIFWGNDSSTTIYIFTACVCDKNRGNCFYPTLQSTI